MRAAVIREFGEPSVVAVQGVDDPIVGPDYVLIRVAALGPPADPESVAEPSS